MKKITIISLMAIIISGPGANYAQAQNEATFRMIPSVKELSVGGKLQLDVNLYPNGQRIDALRLNLHFPPELLTLQNAAKEKNWEHAAGSNVLNNSTGLFSYGAGLAGGTNQSGKFVTLVFEALKSGEAKIWISNDSLALTEGDNKYDIDSVSEVFIMIKSGTPKVLGAEMLRDGDLVRGPDKKMYVLINHRKKYISSLTELKKFSGQAVRNVGADTLALYADTNEPYRLNSYKNGTLLRINGKKIFVIINGYKRYISGPSGLKKYSKSPIVNVTAKVLDSYPDYFAETARL